MNRYAIYDQVTGKINRIIEASLGQGAIQVQPGEGFRDVSSSCQDDTHYIDLSVVTGIEAMKTAFSISVDKTLINADGVDKATFTNIPNGTEVFVQLESKGTINDGTLELTNDAIESMDVLFQHVEYLDHQVTINAS